jgi:hypothetical protein
MSKLLLQIKTRYWYGPSKFKYPQTIIFVCVLDRIGGVMVSVLASSAVDRAFESNRRL